MKFMIEYPLHSDSENGAWIDPANIARVARAAEANGIDAFALTDHPAPSKKWLTHGGHETLDPFVGLGFVAAVTERIQLMTYLTVVPYRNPFITAKSMTAVDVLAKGRTIFALGTGYLRSEFAALGVDFDRRNEIFDEAVEVMRQLWTTDELHYEGHDFKAMGVTLKPGAVSQPHPALWLGGNAAVVRRRVAAWGQGWAPLLGSAELSRTTRTPAVATEEDLGVRILEIKDAMAANGRDPETLDVLARPFDLPVDAPADRQLEALSRIADLGVTWSRLHLPEDGIEAAIEAIERHGAEVAGR